MEVPWYNIVWFTHYIPRHAFHLWLVMRRSLKTQDKLRTWDVGPNTGLNLLCCPLCDVQRDSHKHLFFECTFSYNVWVYVRDLADLDGVLPLLQDIISVLQPMGNSRSAKCIFGKLILAATSYFIWSERNNCLFRNTKRSLEDIRDCIMVMVRLKLLTFKFKNTYNVKRLLEGWKMPMTFRLYGC
ncbi:homeodomain-like protein [Tanacetum coccineum]